MSENHCGDCARTRGFEIDPVTGQCMAFCNSKWALRDADSPACKKFKSKSSSPAKGSKGKHRFERGGAIDGRPGREGKK